MGSRLPIWIELQLQPADSGTRLQLTASLSLLNLMTAGTAQGLLRRRIVRFCRLSQLPQEQMQELLARHGRSERQRLVFLGMLVALGLTAFTLSIREGNNSPDQPATTSELESVVP
ncbi:hypothetical protein [Synechococcus sp. LA31]|uniref:hypothetical protein n=1 Tax=Synechococcus sp. LA31 TaxID=2741953 RepID=UPI001BDD45C0|nr:hypothetical protein [Synechococcus sp. LA31]QVV68799.1 hypothetical protein KJJ24_06735 [Synechococcus sp. LA31]